MNRKMLVWLEVLVCVSLPGCQGGWKAPPEAQGLALSEEVRGVVEDYIAAALAGDRATQVRLSVPGKSPARRGGGGLAGVAVEQSWIQQGRALVASVPMVIQQPRGPETGYIVFSLKLDDQAGWRLDDIDFEDEAGLQDEVTRFTGAE